MIFALTGTPVFSDAYSTHDFPGGPEFFLALTALTGSPVFSDAYSTHDLARRPGVLS